MSVAIEFRDVVKRFPGAGRASVDGVSFTLEAGRTLALVGPSGCGKTTMLKCINRLVEPTSGEIVVGGRSVRAMPVLELRRSLGHVIQQVGLFPHLTLADNVAVVPRLLGWPRARIAERVDELLDLAGLPPPPRLPRPPPLGALGRTAAAGRRRPGARRRSAG